MCVQAGEKLALKDTTKGDVIVKLVPLIDNFEAAKNAIKVQSDAEQKIVDSYQVKAACLDLHNRDCPNNAAAAVAAALLCSCACCAWQQHHAIGGCACPVLALPCC